MKKVGSNSDSHNVLDIYAMDVDLNVDTVEEVINSFKRVNNDLTNITFSNSEEYMDSFHKIFPRYADYNCSGISSDVIVDNVAFECCCRQGKYFVGVSLGEDTINVLHSFPLEVNIEAVLNESEENIKKNSISL